MMHKTVVLDVVGLSASIIGEHTPFLKSFFEKNGKSTIKPIVPALTTSVQATYFTGKWPADTGIVGNGWYDKEYREIKFWHQSSGLVQAERIWEKAKRIHPDFTCAYLFGWYNMYSGADYSLTPRPNYLADGRKMPDCYSHPAALRDWLQAELGQFPLFQFWGANANIRSTEWIANAALLIDQKYDPTLSIVYLPHLDYCLQQFGPDFSKIGGKLNEIDTVVKRLVHHYEATGAHVIILSEYGIGPVSKPVYINRVLREAGLISVRTERGLELLDAGASKAFAVADHQVAHVYVNDKSCLQAVRRLLHDVPGIRQVLDRSAQKDFHIGHERAGDFVLLAEPDSWFAYYYWLDDNKAPDFARSVEIHKKPGYDPAEMFMTSKWRALYKLLRKKLGFRYVMDIVPLDAGLVKGSHGSPFVEEQFFPVFSSNAHEKLTGHLEATAVFGLIWDSLFEDSF